MKFNISSIIGYSSAYPLNLSLKAIVLMLNF